MGFPNIIFPRPPQVRAWTGPTTNLLHRYPLDAATIVTKKAIDVVNGNNGTITGPFTGIVGPDGTPGTGLVFSGSNYVNGFSPNILYGTGTKSVFAWINANTTSPVGIISDRGGTGYGASLLINRKASGNFIAGYLDFLFAGPTFEYSYNAAIQTDGSKWTHVGYVLDTTAATLTLYANGSPAGVTQTSVPAESASISNGIIGAAVDQASPAQIYVGAMAQVCIYNAAVSAATVSAIYAAY